MRVAFYAAVGASLLRRVRGAERWQGRATPARGAASARAHPGTCLVALTPRDPRVPLGALLLRVHCTGRALTTRGAAARAEAQLQGFKQQPDAWQQCATFMQQTSDDHVLWYCLSVFEHVLDHYWAAVPEPDRAQIRQFLFTYATQQSGALASYVQNKIVKVYADVGKQDWQVPPTPALRLLPRVPLAAATTHCRRQHPNAAALPSTPSSSTPARPPRTAECNPDLTKPWHHAGAAAPPGRTPFRRFSTPSRPCSSRPGRSSSASACCRRRRRSSPTPR